MKRIVVLALESQAIAQYCENLRYFFSGYAQIEGIHITNDDLPGMVDADVIVISNQTILRRAKPYLPADAQVVFVDISFPKAEIEKLRALPKGAQVLLVDYREFMAIALAAMLNQFGIQHLDFVPCAPDSPLPDLTGIHYAVTPDLPQFVPAGIAEIVDIGYRKIDIMTISSIASILDIDSPGLHKKMIDYEAGLCLRKHGITRILKSLQDNQIKINVILESIDDGVIITDDEQRILHCSEYVCKAMGQNRHCVSTYSADMLPACNSLIRMKDVENHNMQLLHEGHKRTVVVTRKELKLYDTRKTSIIIVKDAETIQNMEFGIRKKQLAKAHAAKYSFDDIIHCSRLMTELMRHAQKIAQTDAATLILGETGTGKELLAQAIHNSSRRSDKPFIAINCAAISDSLLESELFGYEEGAFTGAKKGGKKSLFELAHGGTVFLDELGNISRMMQVKLLRVLQEKEIMRIGGVTLIPVDVRIIAATNENMEALVENGTFRKDLYYRINNFSIIIPPLRERREDIPLLTQFFLHKFGVQKNIHQDLTTFLLEHEWNGNVRELRNCVEYIAFMGEDTLSLKDLPTHIKNHVPVQAPSAEPSHQELFEGERQLMQKIIAICHKRSLGRRGLLRLLHEQGASVSEYKLRQILEWMKSNQLIRYGVGRQGIRPAQPVGPARVEG